MKRSSFKRLAYLLFVIGFFVFLAVSAVFTLRNRETVSYYENRTLASFPEYSQEGVADGSWFSDINEWMQDHCFGRDTILKNSTRLNLMVRPVVNDVVVKPDVLLAREEYWTYGQAQLAQSATEMADRLAGHAAAAAAYGGVFYYVAVPHQALCYDDAYPTYLQSHADYCREAAAALFSNLEERNVKYIDMCSVMQALGSLKQFSSTVDNHYNMFGAYETYRAIMEALASESGFELDYLEPGEFEMAALPNHYMGSRARKIFDLWDSDESLYILRPDDEVPYRIYTSWVGIEGGTERADVYVLPESEYEVVDYEVYMGGDIPFTEIRTDRDELPSVLIYGDSFTNPVECIIWHDFDTMYSIDFRHFNEMSLDAFLAEYQPDVVICIRDYEALLWPNGNGE